MKKLTILLSTAGILALGWGALVVNQINDQPVEVETYIIPSQPGVPVVEAPVSHSKAAQEVLEPETLNIPVSVEETIIEHKVPYWREFLDNKLATDPNAEIIVKCLLDPTPFRNNNMYILAWYANPPGIGLSSSVRDFNVERVYAYMVKYLETYPERENYCA